MPSAYPTKIISGKVEIVGCAFMPGILAGEADLIGILQEIIPLEFNQLLLFLQK